MSRFKVHATVMYLIVIAIKKVKTSSTHTKGSFFVLDGRNRFNITETFFMQQIHLQLYQ